MHVPFLHGPMLGSPPSGKLGAPASPPNPTKRPATPEEMARVVAFLSRPAASFVAGANSYVDGGSVNHVQF